METFECESCKSELHKGYQSNNVLNLCIDCDEWEQQRIAEMEDEYANGAPLTRTEYWDNYED